MGTTVQAPDGARWRVGRRWLPWKPRLRKPEDLPVDGALEVFGFLDELPVVVAVIGVVVILAFVLFVAIPLLLALAELVLLAVLLALGTLVRVVLRRPWIVDAVRVDRTERLSWKVVGWRRSGEVEAAVAQQLSTGQQPTALPDATAC